MNRDKLQILLNDRLLNKAEHISDDDKNKTMQKMHDFHMAHEAHEDVIVAIEEMAELTQILSKLKRGKIDKTDIGLAEEIADVRLCMYEISKFVFGLSMEALNVYTSMQVVKDADNKYDSTVIAMSRMGKLSHELALIVSGKKGLSDNNLMKSISKVNASMLRLLAVYDIDLEIIRHIEDIKMERTKERLKNGTN